MRRSSSGTSPIPRTPSRFTSDISTRRIEAEWYHFIKLVPWNTITVGGEYRNEVGEVKGSYKQTIDSWAIVLQDQIALFDSLYPHRGHPLRRQQRVRGQGDGPRGGLLSRQGHRHAAEGELGAGLPRADVQRAVLPGLPAVPGRSAIPISSRRRATSWDAGVEQHLWDRRVRLAATYFHTDFKNLIQSTLTDPGELLLPGPERRQGALRGRRGGGQRDAGRRARLSRSPTRTRTPRTGRRGIRSRAWPPTPSR